MIRLAAAIVRVTAALFVASLLLAPGAEADRDRSCLDANTDNDLVLAKPCDVPAGLNKSYRHIHIVTNGVLNFLDGGETTIWARAILVEDGGTLKAGTLAEPFGSKGGRVTIYLYGETQNTNGLGVRCKSETDKPGGGGKTVETCGAPWDLWFSNVDPNTHKPKDTPRKVKDVTELSPAVKATYQGPQDDYFYAYHPMFHDEGDMQAYFGYKTLGVSYGGTLELFGKKGAIYKSLNDACRPGDADSTGTSWVRLARTANKGESEIYVETPPCGLDWADKDDLVLTTTDYLPGHSEQLKISGTPAVVKAEDPDAKDHPELVGTTRIKFAPALQHIHNGKRFPLDNTSHPGISRLGLNADLMTKGAETRAAVGLLSRSIRIFSGGTKAGELLPAETDAACTGNVDVTTNTCYFGGHTVFRQGFKAVQIQGVEFYQMGQGGRLGHYPVHFHHARKTQDDAKTRPATFVMDSSVWDSMTRWITLHGTHDVTLARNVGYKSIGHGYYLEDGTEINNKFYANLGVFARAAVNNAQNTRKVPGILAAQDLDQDTGEQFPFKSDYDHPTVFWIMNGWNDFQYNQASGAGTCGTCYWFVPAGNSTISRDLKWESYASLQAKQKGVTPLMKFVGNSCSTAMTSFQTVGETAPCLGVGDLKDSIAFLEPIHNSLAPKKDDPDRKDANDRDDPNHLDYYPTVDTGGNRAPTLCGGLAADPTADCTDTPKCSDSNPDNCLITILDRYTTSFHWAQTNFAAIWLRPQWYLLTDSVITDVQQAGVTMVTGGGYSSSDVIPGHWALTRKSVFIGNTQDCPTCDVKDNPYASNGGPFNPKSTLRCVTISAQGNRPGNRCVNIEEGVSFPVTAFGMYQRLFSVYDGPAYQDSNAFINITHRTIDDCKPHSDIPNQAGFCDVQPKPPIDSVWLAGIIPGLQRDVKANTCYMPNAAIGWKQPNGFYYPPAFHSRNLFFDNVETRHFVVTPLFKEGTLETNIERVAEQYCAWNKNLFAGFTSIDRQTVLNDDDGTLTGYTGPDRPSIVVNLDEFFTLPVEAIECRSDDSSRASPYAWVTTVLYPRCATDGKCALPATDDKGNRIPNPHAGDWDRACSNENCFGVPLHRLDRTKSDKGQVKTLRMMGQSTGQRSSLTVNHGTYYFDTTKDKATQLLNFHKPEGGIAKCDDPTPTNQECNINVFQSNETYYLFLIYAKPDTEQTYRFFVGPGTDQANPQKDVALKIVRAEIGPNPVAFHDAADVPAANVKWVGDKSQGIVEVVLKAADLPSFADKLKAAKKNACKPATFCAWDDNEPDADKACKQCTSFDAGGKCLTKGSADICRWAVKDPHCPEGGCLGLRFTLPGSFSTGGPGPDVTTLAKDLTCSDANFNVAFTKVDDGTCPAEGPPPPGKLNDRIELDFTDVVRTDGAGGDCQGQPYTDAFAFPHCKCP